MKLQFIKDFSPQQAVDSYVEEKIWKIGGKNPQKRPRHLIEYLVDKMVSFVKVYPAEKQEEVKALFETKLARVTEQNIQFPLKTFDKADLINRIRSKFEECYPGLNYRKTPSAIDDEIVEKWENDQDFVEARWKVNATDSGSANIRIEKLKASTSATGKGRAINFLKVLVEELQRNGDPHASITLEAWTGFNSNMGVSNGAYTWAKLGFRPIEYTREEREDGLSDEPKMERIKKGLAPRLAQHIYIHQYFLDLANLEKKNFNSEHFLSQFPILSQKALACLSAAKYPWDIADIVVDGYPFGKYLMSKNDEARFPGVLYPNLSNSPGMKQFVKRLRF